MAEAALAGGVQAQTSTNAADSEQLETVVVTAERRSENVQSGEQLLQEGRYSLQSNPESKLIWQTGLFY
jgi:hypothetical protein